MAFWGIEIKPGEPYTHHFDKSRGRLHISQATLGIGNLTEMSVVQCNVSDDNDNKSSPIFLCVFSPGDMMNRSCPLNLEFEDEKADIVFSVLGLLSVHLTGFFLGNGSNAGVSGDVATEKMVESGGDSGIYHDFMAEHEVDIMKKDSEDHHDTEVVKKDSEDHHDTEVVVKEASNISEGRKLQTRKLASGLIIEDLELGNDSHNNKIALPGREVTIEHIGKLKSNGEIKFSSRGKKPYKFLLGVHQTIKGLELGVYGMRIGDKRRLTIPPSLGFGSDGDEGHKVPPNAWLIFKIKLVDVC